MRTGSAVVPGAGQATALEAGAEADAGGAAGCARAELEAVAARASAKVIGRIEIAMSWNPPAPA
jgi:hypothetical protein